MLQASRLPRSLRDDPALVRLVAHRPFRRMLAHQGIDPTRDWSGCEGMLFRALQKCATCTATEACRAWLAEPHPPGVYPSFCPNGATFEACRIFLDPPVSAPTNAAPSPALADPPSPRGGVLAEIEDLMGRFL
jgi:hypothetical protein